MNAVALRIFVYDEILVRGRPPALSDIAAHFAVTEPTAKRAVADLRIGKTILADSRSGEIWMAGPFSAIETPYRVVSGNRTWWANCAWDMLGVVMIVNQRSTIYTNCTDCGSPMTIVGNPAVEPNEDAVVHFLVPARHWYDDIGFT